MKFFISIFLLLTLNLPTAVGLLHLLEDDHNHCEDQSLQFHKIEVECSTCDYLRIVSDNELFKKLDSFYKEKKDEFKDEFVAGNFIQSDLSNVPSSLLDLTDDLRQNIHSALKKPLEKWSQNNLEPTFVYGIRDYKEGAVLVPHRDRENTHIISAIINIAKDVEEDWPLVIEDHFYRKHEIFLEPGEVIFYESARLLHGRPYPLKGKSFANIFCHFRPID